MKTIMMAAGCAAFLAGCAQNPQKTSLELSTTDVKYASAECRHIRDRVLEFDEEIGKRAAIGLASGLLLGPFGIPIAIAADADKNTQRDLLNKELARRCVSEPAPA